MTPILTRSVRAVVVVAALGATATGCGTSQASAPTTRPATTVAPSTTTTTTSTAPSTTAATVATPPSTAEALPVAPQPTAEAAAAALVSAWARGDMGTALRVATASAANTLFAVRYPNGLAIDRGCTSAFPPIICTYGPPGGGPTNAAIFQLSVSQAGANWYVSSVRVES